jgi:hypothetical protein
MSRDFCRKLHDLILFTIHVKYQEMKTDSPAAANLIVHTFSSFSKEGCVNGWLKLDLIGECER